jgi:hypothetical protein
MREFLRLLDAELVAPITVTVIGGAAIGLEYETRHATTDIDLTPIGDEAFWKAVERVRSRLPDPVPVQPVGLYAAPYDYEDRRRPLEIAELRFLRLLVPEVHDLALMKVARGLTHDLEALEDVHRGHAFDLETLIARYFDTRTQVTGSLELFRLSFLAFVERIFGEGVAKDAERRLEKGPAGVGGGV